MKRKCLKQFVKMLPKNKNILTKTSLYEVGGSSNSSWEDTHEWESLTCFLKERRKEEILNKWETFCQLMTQWGSGALRVLKMRKILFLILTWLKGQTSLHYLFRIRRDRNCLTVVTRAVTLFFMQLNYCQINQLSNFKLLFEFNPTFCYYVLSNIVNLCIVFCSNNRFYWKNNQTNQKWRMSVEAIHWEMRKLWKVKLHCISLNHSWESYFRKKRISSGK